MTRDLTRLMQLATGDLCNPIRPEQTLVSVGRRRRRRQLTAAFAGAVAVSAAVIVPLAMAGTNEAGTQQLVPATSAPQAPTIIGSVYGVNVTYLPTGWSARSQLMLATSAQPAAGAAPPETSGGILVYQDFGPALPSPGAMTEYATIAVQRGASADLDTLARDNKLAVSWMTVSGHRALLRQEYVLTNGPDSNPKASTNAYKLEWVPQAGVTISVRVNRSDQGALIAQRIADGLVVGAPIRPANPSGATAAIHAAIEHAFTGGQPDATVLSGVQKGEELTTVLQQLKRTNAAVAASSRVTDPGQVFFFDARHATVDATITYAFNGSHGGLKGLAMIDDGTGWKVSQADFCNAIQTLVPACPPR